MAPSVATSAATWTEKDRVGFCPLTDSHNGARESITPDSDYQASDRKSAGTTSDESTLSVSFSLMRSKDRVIGEADTNLVQTIRLVLAEERISHHNSERILIRQRGNQPRSADTNTQICAHAEYGDSKPAGTQRSSEVPQQRTQSAVLPNTASLPKKIILKARTLRTST